LAELEKKEYKSFVFTHIPKCGGTSFRKYVNDSAVDSGIQLKNIYIPGINGLKNDKNLPQLDKTELQAIQDIDLKVLANHCKFEENIGLGITPNAPYHFTILRDPVKRFISHYHFFYYTLGYNNCKGVRLDELSEKNFSFLIEKLGNIQTGYLSNIKFKKIVGLENMLKISKYNLQYEFGSFGLVEDMETTLELLRSTIPDWLNLTGDFPNLNISNSMKVDLPEEIISRISEANKYDLELYEFAKDLFYKLHSSIKTYNSVKETE